MSENINYGELSEAINDKMDRDLNNRTNDSGLRKLVESYVNGTYWYKVFDEIQSDGTVKQWCVQGGQKECTSAWISVTFLKAFENTNYFISGCCSNATKATFETAGTGIGAYPSFMSLSTTSCTIQSSDDGSFNNAYCRWRAEGYIS